MLWRVTGSVKAINKARTSTHTPQRPFAQSTSHLQIIMWDFFFIVGVSVCGIVLWVICYKNSYESANVSLGECDFGAHHAQGQWPGLVHGARNLLGGSRRGVLVERVQEVQTQQTLRVTSKLDGLHGVSTS